MSADWLAKAEGYIAAGELRYALWALSAASGRFRETGDLAGMKRVLEVAESLRPSLQDRGSEQHCAILTGGARDHIRFLTYQAEVAKLVELRDAGSVTLDEFNKRRDEIPDWRAHQGG